MGRTAAGWGAPRRRLLPGWLALVGAVAALLAVIYFPWRESQDFAQVTFRPWTCEELPADADWSAPPDGCTASVPGLQLQLFQANSPNEPDQEEGDAIVFERLSTASIDYSLQVQLDSPADQVLLHPAAHGDEPMTAFHGDASGQHWTTYWRPSGRTVFDVLVVRAETG
ncbi:hypothetical protein [Ornithinicoccus halotolerans]|uniref:hypothetical protein n=1 Tax=Ornithinicoccus halotolerans TaxID=1748220 RepID=UPI001294BEBE|nr:hypothetical protein [Ornithinicoccus halotolerans]